MKNSKNNVAEQQEEQKNIGTSRKDAKEILQEQQPDYSIFELDNWNDSEISMLIDDKNFDKIRELLIRSHIFDNMIKYTTSDVDVLKIIAREVIKKDCNISRNEASVVLYSSSLKLELMGELTDEIVEASVDFYTQKNIGTSGKDAKTEALQPDYSIFDIDMHRNNLISRLIDDEEFDQLREILIKSKVFSGSINWSMPDTEMLIAIAEHIPILKKNVDCDALMIVYNSIDPVLDLLGELTDHVSDIGHNLYFKVDDV